MSKKLIVFVALLAVAFMGSASAAVENIKVSGSMEMIGLSRYGFDFGGGGNKESDDSGLASITSLRFDADLTENVEGAIILFNQRVWGGCCSSGGDGDDTIILGAAWITLKDFLNYPLTIRAGRQGIRLGDGLIMGDPNTNQTGLKSFSSSVFADFCGIKTFDGIVAVFDYNPMVLTLGGVKVSEGDTGLNDDRNVWIAELGYDFTDYNSNATVYYVGDDRKKVDINNYGIRMNTSPVEDLTVKGEFAYQTARGDSVRSSISGSRSDTALTVGANYEFSEDMGAWLPMNLGVDYTRLSRNWDKMYEDFTPADIANVLFTNTNLEIIGATLTANPTDDVTLKLRYANLSLADKVPGSSWSSSAFSGCYYVNENEEDLGNEFDVHVIYDYTEDLQFTLMAGCFEPGDHFTSENDDTATQVVGKMKLSF